MKYEPNVICPWCNEPIKVDEPKTFDERDGEWFHLGCAMQIDDDPSIWGYEGDG